MIEYEGFVGTIFCSEHAWLEHAGLESTGIDNQFQVVAPGGIRLNLNRRLGKGSFGTVYLYTDGGAHSCAVKVVNTLETYSENTYTLLDAPRHADSGAKRDRKARLVAILGGIDCQVVYTKIFDVDNTFVLLMEKIDTNALEFATELRNKSNLDAATVWNKIHEINTFSMYALKTQVCSMTGDVNFVAADFKLDNVGTIVCADQSRQYSLIDGDQIVLLKDPDTGEELIRDQYYPAAYFLMGAIPHHNGRYHVSEARMNAYFQAILAVMEMALFALKIPDRYYTWYTLFRRNGTIQYYSELSPKDVYSTLIQTVTQIRRLRQFGNSRFEQLRGYLPPSTRGPFMLLLENIKQQLTGFFSIYREYGMLNYHDGVDLTYFHRGKKTLDAVEEQLQTLAAKWTVSTSLLKFNI